ncbi:uncharacterized protein LOC117110587 [Anneissia japonica]|uniref:uncharacterized protein LOC117110587 n=1 Tax=Anneissia japonica TaxID=1529436 RepID=UPI001425A748|nr:uncharacterized protein LOC117110587 [Anneissia japonica]
MSQADEVTYETPKKTEEESYEQLTYKQPDSDTSAEKALDGTYKNLPPSSPEKVVENTHHVRPKHHVVTSLSKPKKSKHTITKLNTPITYVNLSNAVSKAEESAYETPIPTVQNSYEQLTYKQPACETSTENNRYEKYTTTLIFILFFQCNNMQRPCFRIIYDVNIMNKILYNFTII